MTLTKYSATAGGGDPTAFPNEVRSFSRTRAMNVANCPQWRLVWGGKGGRSLPKSIIIIFVIFALGLVGFYAFSTPYGDGLEKTMENAGVEEDAPLYAAPLDYGKNYPMTYLMGIIGFVCTLCAVLLYGLIMRKRR